MSRGIALSAVLLWVGGALVLSQVGWFSRRALADRLRPYEPGGLATPAARAPGSSTWREVLAPLARQLGDVASGLAGVREDVGARLDRIHAPVDVTAFRMRQLAWSAVGFAGGGVLAVATRPPLPVLLLFAVGGPVLGFLVVEQQLAGASDRWKRRIFLELPVVSEQLGMLLGAGFSLGAALNRLASRGHGACAADLTRVCGRIRQGLSEVDALREWSVTADVDALTRLVAVLALNREAGDLGRLVSEEARSIRRDVQRELIEQIERRSQQVWIPVTVATLVPGAILLAVPFIEALRLFSSS
jgi:Flp pilus assembly protein TadB